MKRILILALLVGAAPMLAQEATLAAPETVSATKVVVDDFNFSRGCLCGEITLALVTADGATVTRRRSVSIGRDGDNVTAGEFLAALRSPRASETGGDGRRINFRLLGVLFDNGELPGVTLVP